MDQTNRIHLPGVVVHGYCDEGSHHGMERPGMDTLIQHYQYSRYSTPKARWTPRAVCREGSSAHLKLLRAR